MAGFLIQLLDWKGGGGGALTYSCKLSGSLWYFLNQYHQARPGGGSMSISFNTKRAWKRKIHTQSQVPYKVYILYTCLQLGPGEASCILLRFYMTAWLDYNVPI